MPSLPAAAIQAQVFHVLHRAFVQARNLTLRGDCRELSELADTFEMIPELMVNWDDTTLERIRGILREYEASHPHCGYEYVSLLDGCDRSSQSNGFRPASSEAGDPKTSKSPSNGCS